MAYVQMPMENRTKLRTDVESTLDECDRKTPFVDAKKKLNVNSGTMAEEMSVVCQMMYFREGNVYPGDEQKVARLEKQIDDWERDVVQKKHTDEGQMAPTRATMAGDLWELMYGNEGYWCQGKECECDRSHWVRQSAEYFCWECMHDPCACRPPLLYDKPEEAYYRVNSRGGVTPEKIWMSIPQTTTEVKKWWRDKQKVREYEERQDEMRACREEQEEAQNEGFCCHMHAMKKKEEKEERKNKKARTIDGPHHCIYCDEDPCAFLQIQSDLSDNDDIYYVTGDYEKDPSACNGGRQDRAYKYAAYILWDKRGYEGKHYGVSKVE